jgi:hypothetical protein
LSYDALKLGCCFWWGVQLATVFIWRQVTVRQSSYCRLGRTPFTNSTIIDNTIEEDQEMVYIATNEDDSGIRHALNLSRGIGVHIPEHSHLDMISAVPLVYWDHVDSCFLTVPNLLADLPMVLAVEFSLCAYGYREEIVVIIRRNERKLHVFRSSDAVRVRDLLFQGRTRIEGISWENLLTKSPQLELLKDSVELYMVKDNLRVNFSLQYCPWTDSKAIAYDELMSSIVSIGSQRSNASV